VADIQFGVCFWGIESPQEISRFVRRADDLGYDVLAAPDHLGWLSPFAVLAAAAVLSERLRLRTYVLNAAFSLRGLTSGALLGSFLLVLFWKRARALPVLIGTLTSLAGMIIVSRFEWTATAATGAAVKVRVAWPWFTLIGTLVTLGMACVTREWLRRKPSE